MRAEREAREAHKLKGAFLLMPVIGRLDEQVDAVLIAPLEKRGEQQLDASADPSHENIAPPQRAMQTADETDSQGHTRADREELPVWLL